MMHSFLIAIFVAALAPMAVLSNPWWHPHGPPPGLNRHHESSRLKPSATSSTPSGILPNTLLGAGSTGTPKLYELKKQEGVSGVPGSNFTGTLKLYAMKKQEGVSALAGAGSTGTPKLYAVKEQKGTSSVADAGSTETSKLAIAPAASATVSVTSYD